MGFHIFQLVSADLSDFAGGRRSLPRRRLGCLLCSPAARPARNQISAGQGPLGSVLFDDAGFGLVCRQSRRRRVCGAQARALFDPVARGQSDRQHRPPGYAVQGVVSGVGAGRTRGHGAVRARIPDGSSAPPSTRLLLHDFGAHLGLHGPLDEFRRATDADLRRAGRLPAARRPAGAGPARAPSAERRVGRLVGCRDDCRAFHRSQFHPRRVARVLRRDLVPSGTLETALAVGAASPRGLGLPRGPVTRAAPRERSAPSRQRPGPCHPFRDVGGRTAHDRGASVGRRGSEQHRTGLHLLPAPRKNGHDGLPRTPAQRLPSARGRTRVAVPHRLAVADGRAGRGCLADSPAARPIRASNLDG